MPRDPATHRGASWIIVGIAVVVLAVSCGGSDSTPPTSTPADPTTTAGATTTTAEPTTTTAGPTSTAAPAESTSTTATNANFTETTDIVYLSANGVDLLMDVYTPTGEGPWPVVVAFHGVDSRGKDSEDNLPIAEAAAAEGMMVYAPSWIIWDPIPFPFTIDTFEGWKRAANCAVAFAQQDAAARGGDPSNTVVYGFSGGAGIGLVATVEPASDPIPGCATDALPMLATGAVLGDAVYFMHNEDFDAAFDQDLEAMQAEVAALVDPTNWPQALETEFWLWVDVSGTNRRRLDDPPEETAWLALRDPTGSITADLERIGQLDDELISTVDAGELLALRLSEAGFAVTLDAYPGGHTIANKVPELLEYLRQATNR